MGSYLKVKLVLLYPHVISSHGEDIFMRVIVGCEYSGVVRDAFRKLGHSAYSCDIIPGEGNSDYHIQADIMEVVYGGDSWDLAIYHPPCTYLARSGARWWNDRLYEQFLALCFVDALLHSPISKIALENPIGKISTSIRKPDQIIQPWQFGHGETKATCLWLKGLPLLKPTDIVTGRVPLTHFAQPGPNRGHLRSRTLPGIAAAMANQWGGENYD